MHTLVPSDLSIYVIDDDAMTRMSVSQLIRMVPAETLDFGSAEEFLAAYDGRPGILVCDVRMPRMTGLELQARLAEQDIFMPVVLMTGFCGTRLVVEAIRNGATTVLPKPFTNEELLLALHEAIADFRSGIEQFAATRAAKKTLLSLTDSEREVVSLLKKGYQHKEIALELDVSVRTVVLRCKKIFEKMQVDNVIDLFRRIVLAETADLRSMGRRS